MLLLIKWGLGAKPRNFTTYLINFGEFYWITIKYCHCFVIHTVCGQYRLVVVGDCLQAPFEAKALVKIICTKKSLLSRSI